MPVACAGGVGPDIFRSSNGLGAALAGADANAILQGENEDLAVADAPFRAGASGFHDRVDGWLDKIFVDRDLQLYLTQQVYGQLMAAVHFGVPLLPAEALDIDDG